MRHSERRRGGVHPRPRATIGGIFLAAALLATGPDLTPGRVVERIVCDGNPAQSYALYLPRSYSPEKRWPVLYALDAGGRALVPIERFRDAADEYGWILVSSYNTRSDTKGDPNTPAMNAMWNDTTDRLAIDGRRVYATGFSGGGRAAVFLAYRTPGLIAGVIGCGAGFADPEMPVKDVPFAYFGTVGNRDFNYYEMRALDEKLSAAGAPHRIEIFDGGHDWPPPSLAREAIAWMEIEAIRSGTKQKKEKEIAVLYRRALEAATRLEADGKRIEAYRFYTGVAEDFRGLADVSAAAEKAAALGRSSSISDFLKDARRRDDRDRFAIQTLTQKLRRALNSAELPLAGIVAADLGIAGLKKKTASADSPEERLSAERILANLRVQTSYYLPEQFVGENDYPRARLVLSLAAEIDPEDPRVDYNLASAAARTRHRQRALRDLQRAAEKGFRRFDLLDEDEDFASLRGDPEFQKWLARARATASPRP